jgi:energy-coupling factor transport system ATP-binding protein
MIDREINPAVSVNAAPISEAAAIVADNIQFAWASDRPVLKGCSLNVPHGQFWMLLGTNGCGKSTLLRILAGLLPLQQGQINLRPPIGFVFQNPDHQLVMPTVGADVAFGLVEEGLSYAQVRQRVDEALNAVNLQSFLRRPIYALSGGQKQRVAIAGAIARHCEVLMLDEPTALLDPDSQLELVEQVRNLVKSRGITALWVTHRLNELDFCDGAILLDQGQIIDQGDPQRLKQKLLALGQNTSEMD